MANERCVTSPSRSGVFGTSTDRRVEEFTESVSFDRRLYAHDIAGSIAHAQMLAKVGLISRDECAQMVAALDAIRQEIAPGSSRCVSSWKTSTCTSSRR